MSTLENLLKEVEQRVNEATPDLLPRLLKRFMNEDRPGLVDCKRHTQLLYPYVAAQILLTKVKRDYYNLDPSDAMEKRFREVLARRDNVRKTYRAEPCACWQTKR